MDYSGGFDKFFAWIDADGNTQRSMDGYRLNNPVAYCSGHRVSFSWMFQFTNVSSGTSPEWPLLSFARPYNLSPTYRVGSFLYNLPGRLIITNASVAWGYRVVGLGNAAPYAAGSPCNVTFTLYGTDPTSYAGFRNDYWSSGALDLSGMTNPNVVWFGTGTPCTNEFSLGSAVSDGTHDRTELYLEVANAGGGSTFNGGFVRVMAEGILI